MSTPIADTFSSAGTYPAAEGPLQHRSYATSSLPAANSLPAGTSVWDSTVKQLKVTDASNWNPIGTGGGGLTITSLKTSAYAAQAGDFVRCDPSSAGFTVTIPAAVGNGSKQIVVKVQSNSANAVTIAFTGADTVDGATTSLTLYARESLFIVSDNVSDWMVIQ